MTRSILLSTFILLLSTFCAGQKSSTGRSFLSQSAYAHPHAGGNRGNAPANDDCANAQAITVTADCSAPVAGTTIGATQDGGEPVCDTDAGAYLDVWYTFNSGSGTDLWITLTPVTSGMDYAFTLQDACGGAEVYCVTIPGSPLQIPVTANSNYWVRVYSNETYGPTGDFSLCVSTDVIIAPPPPNDLCTAVTAQTVSVGSTVTFTGDNTGATDSEGLGVNSAWEAFTLTTCADVKIDYCGTTPAFAVFYFVLFTGCPATTGIFNGSYDSTACGDQNYTICFANLEAGTYYYPIVQTANATGPYTLHVSTLACGTDQAGNDECDGAIPLTVSADCQPSTFSNVCATQSLDAMLCDGSLGNANDDVWYSFTATASDMSVGGAPNGSMDIAMQLFSGTCASLTAIDCADLAGAGGPDDLQASGLTIGDTYYLRVYDWANSYAYQDPSYELCVVEGLGSGVGVNDIGALIGDLIFPNPTDGDFTVRVDPHASQVNISVIDATGRVIAAQQRQANGGLVHMRTGGALLPGLYIVRVDDGNSVQTERLFIR